MKLTEEEDRACRSPRAAPGAGPSLGDGVARAGRGAYWACASLTRNNCYAFKFPVFAP